MSIYLDPNLGFYMVDGHKTLFLLVWQITVLYLKTTERNMCYHVFIMNDKYIFPYRSDFKTLIWLNQFASMLINTLFG